MDFDMVDSFEYLGMEINASGNNHKNIQHRILTQQESAPLQLDLS